MLQKPKQNYTYKNQIQLSLASQTTYQDSFETRTTKQTNAFSYYNQKVYTFRKKKFYQGKYYTKDTQGNKIQFRLFNDKDLKFDDIGGDDLQLEFDEDNQTDDETLQKFIKAGINDMLEHLDNLQNKDNVTILDNNISESQQKATKTKHNKNVKKHKSKYQESSSQSQDSKSSSYQYDVNDDE